MGYKDENLKHRLGVDTSKSYHCPKCGHRTNLNRRPSIYLCTKCKEVSDGKDLIEK